jgi:hypothetical protein
LDRTIKFRCSRGKRRVLDPDADVQERHEAPVIFTIKPKNNSPAGQPPPRMNGVPENPLTYYFEAPDRKPLRVEVFHDESDLRLCNQ